VKRTDVVGFFKDEKIPKQDSNEKRSSEGGDCGRKDISVRQSQRQKAISHQHNDASQAQRHEGEKKEVDRTLEGKPEGLFKPALIIARLGFMGDDGAHGREDLLEKLKKEDVMR
jgi:hypothetical protein